MYIQYRLYQFILLTLIITFLYNAAGYFFVFKYAQACIEEEMDSKLNSTPHHKELVAISFTKQQLSTIHWMKKGEEFSLNGKRYDIARTVETTDGFIFWCMEDEKEDRLYEALANYNDHHSIHAAKSKPPRKRIIVLNPLYFMDKSASFLSIPAIPITPGITTLDDYSKVYLEINYPPPRLT